MTNIDLPWIPADFDHEAAEALDDETFETPDTDVLAEECYTRYKSAYECDHDVKLDAWADLPRNVRGYWCAALGPVAAEFVDLCKFMRNIGKVPNEPRPGDAPGEAAVVAA